MRYTDYGYCQELWLGHRTSQLERIRMYEVDNPYSARRSGLVMWTAREFFRFGHLLLKQGHKIVWNKTETIFWTHYYMVTSPWNIVSWWKRQYYVVKVDAGH